MSNDWGNDWNTDTWNTGYTQPQQTAVPATPPVQENSYGGGYYSQQQQQTSNNQGFETSGYGQQIPSQNNQFGAQGAGGYGQQQQQQGYGYSQNNGFGGFQPQQLMSDPMLNAAKQFGGQFAEQQKEKLTKYLGTFNLKYYFAVDNAYVGKKLGILFFPFFHKDWNLKFAGSADPAPARDDVNAPDLYIPLMSFLTYILVSGFVLGTQGRFSPEILGILTSNALIWVILENIVIFISKYILNISQALSVWHSLAYSTYKFAHMIVCLLLFMVGDKTFYYCGLAYSSLVLVLFLLRSVSHFMFDTSGSYGSDEGRKRKLILVAFVVITQPLIMWWLTSVASNYDYDKFGLAQLAISKMTGGSGSKAKQFMTNDGDIDYEALLKMPKDDFDGM